MRFTRWLSFLSLAALVALPGCNRGDHPAQTGKAAPTFNISDGFTSINLANYRGKVVLLNFWATWCGPCVVELPSLLQLHHSDPNVVILAISIDEDPNAYANFIKQRHMDLITVRDPNQTVPTMYHTDMWPETYLIDRQGIIRRKFVGAQDWSDPEIRQYIASM